MPTAVLVDGAFFLARAGRIYGSRTPDEFAALLHRLCIFHIEKLERPRSDLYRIFFYDCPPLAKKAHNPISGSAIDFSKEPRYAFRTAFHKELRQLRKVALRLGYLDETNNYWAIKDDLTRKLLSGAKKINELTAADVYYVTKQKGVDIRIGIDIASLAYKRQVDTIILISGDSDFVPAAKLARREGIDFVLDPMWAPIRPDLFEHIDGLASTCSRPGLKPARLPLTSKRQRLSPP